MENCDLDAGLTEKRDLGEERQVLREVALQSWGQSYSDSEHRKGQRP